MIKAVFKDQNEALVFAFISLGNIDISGLMDAFPAQHTPVPGPCE